MCQFSLQVTGDGHWLQGSQPCTALSGARRLSGWRSPWRHTSTPPALQVLVRHSGGEDNRGPERQESGLPGGGDQSRAFWW